MQNISKRNFTRGEFAPEVQARRDVDLWTAGAKRLRNVLLLKHGGVRKRPGTIFVAQLPEGDQETRMLPFTFRTGQSYALLMGNGSMKPLAQGGNVLSDGFGITAITQAEDGVVTAPFHGLATGAEVFLAGIEGMVELNNRGFTVVVVDVDRFRLGVDTRAYGAFTGDGGADVRTEAPEPPPEPPVVQEPTPPATPPATVPPGGGGGGGGRDPTNPRENLD